MKSLVKNSLNLFVVGLGCCKQEIFATAGPTYDISRFGVNFVNIPEDADVLVIQGFYNSIAEERLLDYYSCIREPKWVIAVGKCIVEGSILFTGYKLIERIAPDINIDFFVPGCPPRPEAFIYSILRLKDLQ
ncbi:MAG: NADH-quinone oxidoreductase subunit B [Actinobacteria bacterium]|nr:NADH-quinone oxidoreductase subunit B [Actinomycetota bacterium]MBM3713271.1 NADH-quinone oxidoreductase subunit B [Actinomycetota bacterium]